MRQNDAKLIIIGALIEDPSEDENVTRLHRTKRVHSMQKQHAKYYTVKYVVSLARLSGYLS